MKKSLPTVGLLSGYEHLPYYSYASDWLEGIVTMMDFSTREASLKSLARLVESMKTMKHASQIALRTPADSPDPSFNRLRRYQAMLLLVDVLQEWHRKHFPTSPTPTP